MSPDPSGFVGSPRPVSVGVGMMGYVMVDAFTNMAQVRAHVVVIIVVIVIIIIIAIIVIIIVTRAWAWGWWAT
jgi:hypothetical protein